MRANLWVGCIGVLCAALSISSFAQSRSPLESAKQLILVTTPEWGSNQGMMYRYERSGNGWSQVGEPIAVVVGSGGLGWGSGLIAPAMRAGDPTKHEGDGRSPAGVFSISAAFGFEEEKPEWLRLPYLPLNDATECVDDASSSYYNAVVDRVKPDWNSSEKMRSIDVYRWGVVVNQNAARERGAGSCIFLHIWKGPVRPTAGCTAMEQPKLEKLLRWLDSSAHPLMVALPRAEYDRLRSTWQLP
jgi:D-alanyl-D-alanine dipeptidase